MCFFSDHQRGEICWDEGNYHVVVNRTEALDASRAAVRDRRFELPRRSPIVEEFAKHMAADAKVLDEDEETGARQFRYLRTSADHFSMAFTYAWMAGTEKDSVDVLGKATVLGRVASVDGEGLGGAGRSRLSFIGAVDGRYTHGFARGGELAEAA